MAKAPLILTNILKGTVACHQAEPHDKVVWPWSCLPHLLGLQDHHVTCVHNDRTSCTMWLIESSRDIIKSSTYTHLAQCQVANSPPYCLILIVLCAIASVVVSFCHCSDNYWCRSQEVQPLVSPVYLAHYPHLHILLSLLHLTSEFQAMILI